MRHFRCFLFCLLLFTICSCQTVKPKNSISDLYFIGGIDSDENILNPGYYKNNSWIKLETLNNNILGLASYMAMINNDVYVSGVVTNSRDGLLPCMWKNGELSLLPLPDNCKDALAVDIIDLNDKVIIGGTIKLPTEEVPVYWKEGELFFLCLAPNTYRGCVNAIYSNGNNIYCAGHCSLDKNVNIPGYWKNDKWFALPVLNNNFQNVYVHDIKSVNSTIIISGSCIDDNYRNIPCYWFNDKINILNLPNEYLESIPDQILVHNNDIYIAGYYIDVNHKYIPGYWKNNKWIQLEKNDNVRMLKANDICIKNNDVYVVGNFLTKDDGMYSCIWINGKLISNNDYSDKMLVLRIFGK